MTDTAATLPQVPESKESKPKLPPEVLFRLYSLEKENLKKKLARDPEGKTWNGRRKRLYDLEERLIPKVCAQLNR